MEHATEDGIRPARSYGTTPASCKEIKPRNANEVFCTIYLYCNLVFLCSKRLQLDFSWRLLFIYLVFCDSLFEHLLHPGYENPLGNEQFDEDGI